MSNNNVEKSKELRGFGCSVDFEEIYTVKSLVTRRPTEKYLKFAKVVAKNNLKALVQSWPSFVALFDTKEEAKKCYEELKENLATSKLIEGELIFNSKDDKNDAKVDSTQNQEKSDA